MSGETEWVIDVRDLTKRYGDKTVVDRLEMKVRLTENMPAK